ncbi:tail fiber protein [Shigella phage Sf16]|uniref:Tail fiber protein n=2 Tax=Mooglevirus Sf14 TaxID=2560757 RepID=A0A2K9VKD9_9CAUD|nr:tail fiber protein [Shigella phage Sf14]ATE86200.1 tail fiber protein [Shigella phage Sf16]AUV62794.1 tail fiber protein [Shigella phage Sf14]
MAEYKLSELNSIDTVRSEDLLHLRIIKRSDMLGDEDRKMTYANFLASFKLERFLQLTGGDMTGNLGIVKLRYGGKDLLDPTGSSEVILGDTAKTFRINASALRLTVNDATRSATVYHTLNKPSPNELGMRTNTENDARYAMKETENTFLARQIININGVGLTLKSILPDGGAYIEARDSNNALRFTVGNLTSGTDVTLVNSKGATLTLGTNSVSVDKNFEINGQVQPNNWNNLDARFFTQTAADQRFARLNASNNFVGVNNFNGKTYVIADSNALNLRAASENAALFMRGYNSAGTGAWYVGQPDGTQSEIVLANQMTNVNLKIATEFSFNKAINVTGQVKPSDFANFDTRYVPSSLTNVLARTNAANVFTNPQTIVTTDAAFTLQSGTANSSLYIVGANADGNRRWYVGNGEGSRPNSLFLYNYSSGGVQLEIADTFMFNRSVSVSGQVQPTDWTNFDSRYYTQSAANSRYMLSGVSGTGTEVGDATGIAWNAKTGLYNVTNSTGGSTHLVYQMYLGIGASTPSAQLKFNYKNGGIHYRTARDAFGFEEAWAKIYTDQDKPTPSEIGTYTKAEVDQRIASAVTDSTDLKKVYPVGIVTFFASNVNPNTAFPGTTWTYLTEGANRTIRIGSANGSDVKGLGGADTVALSVGHIPAHTHGFSGTTSWFDYGTKYTDAQGAHDHDRGNMEISGVFGWFRSDNAAFYTASGAFAMGGSQASHGFTGSNFTYGAPVDFYASRTWTGRTSWVGAHAHGVGIGGHNHTFSGDTGATGSGAAFSVLNTYIKLMAWVRTA